MLEVAAISTMYSFLVYAFGGESSFSAIPIIDFESNLNIFNGSFLSISAIYILFIIINL